MSDPHVTEIEPLDLVPLAPSYSSEDHGTYVAVLERAIDEHPTSVRNIALAGPYGVGKSSVLTELARRRKNRIISVSLLTLGVAPETPPAGENTNPAASTTSNRIQKEIVKQLLYQQSPRKTALSRFRRIDRPRWGKEFLIAAGVAIVIVGLLTLAGALSNAADFLGLEVPDFPDGVRYWSAGTLVLSAASIIVFLLRMVVRGRLGIEKVEAGPATISLSPRSTSYFDEYLDEIVYFFELNPSRDIVIIEDLDRFNDPAIYESLRSLNSILNASQQLGARDIRFVYAVRDSIFERLGRPEEDADVDDTRAELGRANRTKFFELIIPIVPFITHMNAREVMSGVLEGRGHSIDRTLIDLAARHLPDMRTIHNVVNEYEVFKRRLIDVEKPVPGLNAERLFAMMLFKNTQAADFEAVRQSESSLDRLYDVWRNLVAANLSGLRDKNAQLQTQLDGDNAASEYAKRLGEALRRVVETFSNVQGGATANAIYDGQGETNDEAMSKPAFWQAVLDGSKTLSIRHTINYSQYMAGLTPAAIADLTGLTLDDTRFVGEAANNARARLNRIASHIAFLQRRHTWEELLERPEFRYAEEGSGSQSFTEWAEALLPTPLIFELVKAGFITSYFPLYVSTFYGKLLPPDAMTYIMRNIDSGTPDMDFPLSAEDVAAIIDDQGSTVLTNRSMRNVNILDHLLGKRPDAAETIIERASADRTGVVLIKRYLERGTEKEAFVAALAPHWPAIIRYLVEDAPLSMEEQLRLVSVAVEHRDEVEHDYEYGDNVRLFFEEHALNLAVFLDVDSADDAAAVVGALTASSSVLPIVERLPTAVVQALRPTRNYTLNALNIMRVSGSESLALDAVKSASSEVYAYVISDPAAYLVALEHSPSDQLTVEHPSAFVGVVTDAAGWPSRALDAIIDRAVDRSIVEDLSDVPRSVWSALVAAVRTTASFSNVLAYVQDRGGVDDHLATLILAIGKIGAAPEESVEDVALVALAIVNSSADELTAARRARIAAKLEPGVLPIDDIEPRAGDLIGELMDAGLIEDEEEAFSPRLMVDWPTHERAIRTSAKYSEFAGPSTLQARFVAPLLSSVNVAPAIQARVMTVLNQWDLLPPAAFEAAADCAVRKRVRVSASTILLLHNGGVGSGKIVRLLALSTERVSTDELRDVLRALKGNYAAVADPSRRRPRLADSDAVRAILARLKEGGIVSRYSADGADKIRIFLHHS